MSIRTLHDRPQCPHCKAYNTPPMNRYRETFDTHCTGCLKPFTVALHVRYSTEAIMPEAVPVNDFVVDRIEDRPMGEHLQGVGVGLACAQRNAMLWGIVEANLPFVRRMRADGKHSFALVESNKTLRIYHGKDCGCATEPTA